MTNNLDHKSIDNVSTSRQMDMWETVMRLCLACYDCLEKAWFYAEFIVRCVGVDRTEAALF